MRKWRPPDALLSEEWRQVHQIVVPKIYRQEIMELAHDTPLAGHLGVLFRNGIASGKRVKVHILVSKY
jgi:hypothetical protein